MASTQIEVKQKEAKTLRFTVKDDGTVQDVSLATLTFVVSQKQRPFTDVITVNDAAFDKTNGVNGIVTCPLSATDLDIATGFYDYELKIEFSSLDISKSLNGEFAVRRTLSD